MGGKTEAEVTKVILVVRLGLEPSFLSREVELHSLQHTTTQRKSSIVYRKAVLHQ